MVQLTIYLLIISFTAVTNHCWSRTLRVSYLVGQGVGTLLYKTYSLISPFGRLGESEKHYIQ